MTEAPETAEKRALDALLDEAKRDFAPREGDSDWGRVEEGLMARIAREESPLVRDARLAAAGRSRTMRLGAVALAAAAAAAIFVQRDREATLEDAPAALVETAAMNGGSLRATEGDGSVRIGGVPATPGHVLRGGDLIEAEGARAFVERPGKVTWIIEQEREAAKPARATVKSALEPLVLDLHDGAIEAQVTPVPSGEAFAVDVEGDRKLVRIAVHGTHLRVSRRAGHVTIDLTEGVVSIGVPPRAGSTYGTMVAAPAHVELDVDDLDRTLRIDHAAASVRAPIELGPRERFAAADVPAPSPPAASETAPKHDPRATHDPPRHPANVETSGRPAPTDAIGAAVRACAAAESRPSDVRVTVSTKLKLTVSPSGDVRSAVFDPPLLPGIQECAAPAIYKTTFGAAERESGAVTVPIEFSY